MKSLKLFLFLAISFIVISCENSNPVDNNNNNNASDSYYPMSKGSWWKYKNGVSTPAEYKVTFVGDTTISGKKYMVGVTENFSDRTYARLSNNNIYLLAPAVLNADDDEVLFLKNNPSAGDKWSYWATPNGMRTEYQYEVISIDGARVVNSVTYENVIKVRNTLIVDYMGQKIEAGSVNYYYAKGIGMIEMESSKGKVTLLEYHIAN